MQEQKQKVNEREREPRVLTWHPEAEELQHRVLNQFFSATMCVWHTADAVDGLREAIQAFTTERVRAVSIRGTCLLFIHILVPHTAMGAVGAAVALGAHEEL